MWEDYLTVCLERGIDDEDEEDGLEDGLKKMRSR
jgi:hypothetical protein